MEKQIRNIDSQFGSSVSALLSAANVTLAPGGWIVGGRKDRPCDIAVHVHRADATLTDMRLEESTYDSSLASTGTSQSAWALDCKGGASPIAVRIQEDGSTASGQRWRQAGETLKDAFARLGGCPPVLAIVTHSWRHVDGDKPEDAVTVDIYLPPAFDGWKAIF